MWFNSEIGPISDYTFPNHENWATSQPSESEGTYCNDNKNRVLKFSGAQQYDIVEALALSLQ